MIISNGKIEKCTVSELFAYYLMREYYLLFSFEQFRLACVRNGTELISDTAEAGNV